MMNDSPIYCEETGETLPYEVNHETGEKQIYYNTQQNHRQPTVYTENAQTRDPFKLLKWNNCDQKEFKDLKESIQSGYNRTSPRLLLIPISMFFSPILTVLLALLELYLHLRCHSRNKILNGTDMYYRSPLHMVTSQFCASCREAAASDRVAQLQDQRRHHYDYLRGIVG